MNDADAGETRLRLERLIPSAPEALFELWTQPAHLMKWWAPEGYTASVSALDVRPGGDWRIALHRADGATTAVSGIFRIVEPPRLLAFTWAWEADDGVRGHETEVIVRFEAEPGGTRLVLTQERFESRQARNGHDGGWSTGFDRLAKLVD